MWLFRRTTSSSVQILSAKITTSAAIRPSSIWVSARSSLTFSSNLARYSATISGERTSMHATFSDIPSNLAMISFFRFSPSIPLVSTNCFSAPSSAFFNPFHSSSSSADCSSIVRTSGHLDTVDTRISFSRPKVSSIFLNASRYSFARDSLYFRAT